MSHVVTGTIVYNVSERNFHHTIPWGPGFRLSAKSFGQKSQLQRQLVSDFKGLAEYTNHDCNHTLGSFLESDRHPLYDFRESVI